jgi:hypothetical protein
VLCKLVAAAVTAGAWIAHAASSQKNVACFVGASVCFVQKGVVFRSSDTLHLGIEGDGSSAFLHQKVPDLVGIKTLGKNFPILTYHQGAAPLLKPGKER